MKRKLITCILCLTCLMPLSFGERTPTVYFDSSASAYSLKNVDDKIISGQYDGISAFQQERAIIQKDGKFGVLTLEGKELIPPTYKYISDFKNNLAIVFQGDFAGVINLQGEIVVPIEYDNLSFFKNGHALAYKNKKLGLISSDNKVIHPFVWDEASMLDFTQDFQTFVFRKGATYGVATISGEILIHPQSKELFHISDEEVAFVDQNKIGVMNHDSNVLIPAVYDSIYIAGGGYVGRNNDKYYFINLTKGSVSQGYDSVKEFSDHQYLVTQNGHFGIYDAHQHKEILPVEFDDIRLMQNPHQETDFYIETIKRSAIQEGVVYRGLATMSGKVLLPTLYSRLGFVNRGLIAYYNPMDQIGLLNLETLENSGLSYTSIRFYTDNQYGIVTDKNGAFALLNHDGTYLINPDNNYIYESGNFFIAEKNEKKALFSKDRHQLTPYKYDTIFSFQNIGDTEAAIISVNNRWGLLNTKGGYLVPPKYDAINSFVNGYAIVSKDGLYGFINTKGQLVIEPQFEDVSSFDQGLAIAKLKGKYGFIQTNGRFLIPAVYDNIKPFNSDGKAVVTYKGKKGILQRNGTYFLRPIYKSLTIVDDQLIVLQDSATDKYGLMKATGEVITKMIYDNVGSFFKEEATFVKINEKFAIINKKGEVLTQFIFDEVSLFGKGFANIKIGDQTGFVNTRGEYILE